MSFERLDLVDGVEKFSLMLVAKCPFVHQYQSRFLPVFVSNFLILVAACKYKVKKFTKSENSGTKEQTKMAANFCEKLLWREFWVLFHFCVRVFCKLNVQESGISFGNRTGI